MGIGTVTLGLWGGLAHWVCGVAVGVWGWVVTLGVRGWMVTLDKWVWTLTPTCGLVTLDMWGGQLLVWMCVVASPVYHRKTHHPLHSSPSEFPSTWHALYSVCRDEHQYSGLSAGTPPSHRHSDIRVLPVPSSSASPEGGPAYHHLHREESRDDRPSTMSPSQIQMSEEFGATCWEEVDLVAVSKCPDTSHLGEKFQITQFQVTAQHSGEVKAGTCST